MSMTYEEEIEAFIRATFEENYERLRLESGQALAFNVKETALNQVLLYWRKLRAIAEAVTDTEVHLSLPGCETPQGREYTIEGVVDILQEEGRTVMYDVKTHDADFVRANPEDYEQQLNVYAHIWQELRQQDLDEMAVIATAFPETLQDALASGDPGALEHHLAQWEPVVPIAFEKRRVEETIRAFGAVVDAIEENRFAPRPAADLNVELPGARRVRFATRVCRNCDARFSCDSFREYAWKPGYHGVDELALRPYFVDPPPDGEQEQWRAAGLDAAPDTAGLRADFGR